MGISRQCRNRQCYTIFPEGSYIAGVTARSSPVPGVVAYGE